MVFTWSASRIQWWVKFRRSVATSINQFFGTIFIFCSGFELRSWWLLFLTKLPSILSIRLPFYKIGGLEFFLSSGQTGTSSSLDSLPEALRDVERRQSEYSAPRLLSVSQKITRVDHLKIIGKITFMLFRWNNLVFFIWISNIIGIFLMWLNYKKDP